MAKHEGRPLLLQDLEAPSPREARARQLRANRARQKKRRVAMALTVMTLLLITGFLISKHKAWNLLPPSSMSQSPYADALAAYRANHDFDGVVQVRVNGTVVFEAAEGVADEEFDAPMATDSVFPVGSNSKLFVAVSLYQLQERGLVNLSEPVNAHLNRDDFANFGFPNQTTWCPRVAGAAPDSPCENVTFVQLLHMGSGIGDSFDCDNVDAAHCHRSADNYLFYKGSLAPYVGVFINDPLVFKPDTNYSYANPNYYLLSYLVEKISGMRLEQYVRAMIFDSIGLNDTYYDPYSGALGVRHGYVQQYIHFYEGASPDTKGERLATGSCMPYINSGAISGSGGFRSTISDMQRWFLDLFANQGATSKVLSQASIRTILERVNPVVRAYGQGIGVGKLREDGWPALLNYCGGMKCAVTCMTMLFPDGTNNSSDGTVVISAFSNHMHMGFADRAAFEALRPTNIMIQPDNTTTFYDDGGAVALSQALTAAYSASSK